MNISEILDTIDDMLDKSWGVPLSGGRCVVDVDRLRDLVGDVRLNMPVEIKQAKMIVADRKQIIDDAKREAEAIVQKAEERAKVIVDHDELVKKAQLRASEINTQAQTQSRELKRVTNEFVDQSLQDVEALLSSKLQELKSARIAMHRPK